MNFIFVLIVMMLTSAFLFGTMKYTPESEFEVRLIEGGKAIEIVGFNGTSQTVTIPSEIRGKSVMRIGQEAFAHKGLTTINIPNSVAIILTYAFAGNQLTQVNIPNGVQIIESGAFMNNQLTQVIIPRSVGSIGILAFAENQLTRVTIPSHTSIAGVYNPNNGVYVQTSFDIDVRIIRQRD